MESRKRDTRFELRMNGELKELAMARAKKMGCSLAELVNELLENHLLNSRVEA